MGERPRLSSCVGRLKGTGACAELADARVDGSQAAAQRRVQAQREEAHARVGSLAHVELLHGAREHGHQVDHVDGQRAAGVLADQLRRRSPLTSDKLPLS